VRGSEEAQHQGVATLTARMKVPVDDAIAGASEKDLIAAFEQA
jgi:hypothetical protein